MEDKINKVIKDYQELTNKLTNLQEIKNHQTVNELFLKQKSLKILYKIACEYFKIKKEITEATELLKNENDEELVMFYRDIITQNENLLKKTIESFAKQQSINNPDNQKNAILEIRAGTGGNEASLFAGELYRMYLRYIEKMKWKVEQLNISQSDYKGIKEVILLIKGTYAYGFLKNESGVHRVQRIPLTESSGRIHTSAVSVVVLPEIKDQEIDIDESEIKIDVFRAGGPGGQSVNTTDSAVRITHLPTNTVVTCQDEKSQLKNKQKALMVLKSRLYENQKLEKLKRDSQKRQNSIKGGDRSVKIRTYNYPQNRITDHRINRSWYNLTNVLNGELDDIIKTTRVFIDRYN